MRENIKEQKDGLRREYKLLRDSIPQERKRTLDRAICDSIASLPCFRDADTILLYSPIKSEIDMSYLARKAIESKKRIAYPVCNVNELSMIFRYVSSPSELVRGSYSIPEPPESATEFCNEGKTLCIVPALAFDKQGFRLGYGKGYYDRFLRSFGGISLGAVYHELFCDTLPRGYHDEAVNIIVTERGSFLTDVIKK